MDIYTFKDSFDTFFLSELDRLLSRTKKRIHNPHVEKLLSHVFELAKNGKRIRPYVLSLAYGANSFEDTSEIRDQLVGIELLHLFALIHDDIMDEALTRHEVDSMNYFSEKQYRISEKRVSQGKYEAILIGDMIFSFAVETFSKNKGVIALSLFHELIDEVILGQLIDIRIPFENEVTQEMIKERMLFKTARYSFARPMQIGAVLRGKSDDEVRNLFSLGEELGTIYQITDDIIDIYGSKKDLKKTPLQDLFNEQETLLTFFIKEHCEPQTITRLRELHGKTLTASEISEAQKIFESSGALSFAKNEIETHSSKARFYIDTLTPSHQTKWSELLNILISRTS